MPLRIYTSNRFGWTIQFHVPAPFLLEVTTLILFATALSGIYPARRASESSAVPFLSE